MTWRPSAEFPWARERPLLDSVAAAAFTGRLSLDEEAVLRDAIWARGQDIRLREDARFRQTPWGRWISSGGYLANDAVREELRQVGKRWIDVEEVLSELDRLAQRRCVLCTADPRLVVFAGKVRLSAQELAAEPLLEGDVPPLERYVTHLPVHTLRAAAASEPLGQWGRRAQEEVVETLGWLHVSIPGKQLTPRMFVARIEGHSMDDGRTGLTDGAQAVFEFGAGDFDLEPIVLARGAFTDPETGTYAVKRIRLSRAPDGTITQLLLRSENPDKTRYPDIVIGEPDAPSVTVLARFVAALGPDDHARRPKPEARRGRRDVTSPEGAEKRRTRLRQALLTFFGPMATDPPSSGPPDPGTAGPPGDTATKVPSPWTATLELPAPDPATLVVACGPFTGLLGKVKLVALTTGATRKDIFASNVRHRRWREPMPRSTEPYTFAIVDWEEDFADQTAQLTLPGLAPDAATVFRIGADGVGVRLASAAVTPGNTYRLLVPPALSAVPLEGAVERDGYRALDLHVPSPVPATLLDLLRSIGVTIGQDAYSAAWAAVCPRDYRPGRTGDLYPCFTPADTPVVLIEGPDTLLDGDVRVLVQGERTSETLELPPGGRWLVELASLDTGPHVLEVLPLHTTMETTRLFFRVDEETRPLPRAEVLVTLADTSQPPEARPPAERLGPAPSGQIVSARDLSLLEAGQLTLAITAPPLWPVTARWNGASRAPTAAVHADEEGTVDTAALLRPTEPLRRDEPIGELLLDFRDLGSLVLPHRRQLDEAARVGLARLARERLPALPAFRAELDLLRAQWLDPLLTLLGYRVDPVPLLFTLDVPAGLAVFQLSALRRRGALFERRPTTALVVLPARLSLSDAVALTEGRAEALRLCKKLGLDKAIVTDGRAWVRVQVTSRLRPSPIDIEDALRREALGGLDDFLSAFLVEDS